MTISERMDAVVTQHLGALALALVKAQVRAEHAEADAASLREEVAKLKEAKP